MINIECNSCHNSCCKNPIITILLPSEEKSFREYSEKISTPYREIFVLMKRENGTCIFLDDMEGRCTIYNKRPLDCRLYPFVLDFSNNAVDLKLDPRFCPYLEILTFNKEEVLSLLRKEYFTDNWIEEYKALVNF